MLTDPIADLLTRVRNATRARHKKVDVPASQLKISIVELWKKVGYIRNFKLYRDEQKGIVRIYLKYAVKGRSVIRGLKRVSRSGQRVYVPYHKIPKIMGGVGTTIISTSKGVLTGEMALEQKVGGELLCTLW